MPLEPGEMIEVDGQEMTWEQAQERIKSYRKLESQHTKVSQEKSELEKRAGELEEFAKAWGPFASEINQRPDLAQKIQSAYSEFYAGNVTQSTINAITREANKADKAGDDELSARLEALESQLQERQLEDTLASLEKRAKNDGLEDFSLEAFAEFAEKWMQDELEIGEDDEVTPKEFRQAYNAYKAQLLEETIKRGKIPSLGSQSNGAPPPKGEGKDQPKGLAARAKQAMEYALRN